MTTREVSTQILTKNIVNMECAYKTIQQYSDKKMGKLFLCGNCFYCAHFSTHLTIYFPK